MKSSLAALACLAFLAPALAATPDATCTAPANVALVKQIVREKLMPASYAPDVSISTFARGTRVERAAPSRVDAALRKVWCEAHFTVDASAGLDGDTDRGLQMAFARKPGVLAGLQSAFEGPQDQRRYVFAFGYAVQQVNGDTQVSVTGVDELEAMMTGGLLKAVQAQGQGPRAQPAPLTGLSRPENDADKISGQ